LLRWLAIAGLLSLFWVALLLFRQSPETAMVRDSITPVRAAADTELRVVFFGTSLTARGKWPERVATAMLDCGYSVVPTAFMGRVGASSADGVATVDAYRPDKLDVAIIEYAINDADLLDGVSLSGSRANHQAMIASLRAAYPDIAIVLTATNPVRGWQILKRPRLMRYYDQYSVLARETGVSFFDGTARWAAKALGAADLPDGLHPDPEIEAALYTRPLRDVIAATLDKTCRR
jgi:hypothetical protein